MGKIIAVTLLTLWGVAPATAQPVGVPSGSFEGGGAASPRVVTAWTSRVVPAGTVSGSFTGNYAVNLTTEATPQTTVPVRGLDRAALEASIGVGFGNWLAMDLTVPLGFDRDPAARRVVVGTEVTDFRPSVLSDLRVGMVFSLLHPRDNDGVGLAFGLSTFIPSAQRPADARAAPIRIEPRLILDWGHPEGWLIAGNIAFQSRPERTVAGRDAFRWAVDVQAPLSSSSDSLALRVLVGVHGSFRIAPEPSAFIAGRGGDSAQPTSLMGGLRLVLPGWTLDVLGGGGLYDAVGAADIRGALRVTYSGAGQCQPDGTRCDRDGDGIDDRDDQCVFEAETHNGHADEDGCPEFDQDNDGIVDGIDWCPDLEEDLDGFEDTDGCPDVDNDVDAVLDMVDVCPNVGEDEDEWEDDDGCPEYDNDGDGHEDVSDACPNVPGTDGCPASANKRVRVAKTRIIFSREIKFKWLQSRLQRSSLRTLKTLARFLKDTPRITLVRVEGHTDNRGSTKRNVRLSTRRSEAVRKYLIRKGVAPERLLAIGMADMEPIADNATARGRARNRRVELHIVEVDHKSVE